tara:strand:- start:3532 stop:4212 length:681 start_codon:yes stop_codon:yes gene_type:complete
MFIVKTSDMFQKEKLDQQLRIHKISRDQLLRETLGKDAKNFANWKVKWSRLINKKASDPGNFGLLELSELFAKYFNSRKTEGDLPISTTYFITQDVSINGLGEVLPTGQIRKFLKKEKLKLQVIEKWKNYEFVVQKSGVLKSFVRYFKPLKIIQSDSFYTNSIAQQKKTKSLFIGYLKPLSNGNYNIEDRSRIDGEKIRDIATNITLDAASKIEATNYPVDDQWQY